MTQQCGGGMWFMGMGCDWGCVVCVEGGWLGVEEGACVLCWKDESSDKVKIMKKWKIWRKWSFESFNFWKNESVEKLKFWKDWYFEKN